MPKPSPNSYSFSLSVKPEHIDRWGHVNNIVYIDWILDAAIQHSESLGFNYERYKETGGTFFVRRHEIDYMLPAYEGEELEMETWCGELENVTAIRFYRLKRVKDQALLIRAKTVWVYIDLQTGKPKKIPEILCQAFAPDNAPLPKANSL